MKENGAVNTMSNYDKIAQRAYELWDKSGRPQAKETEHWLQAEAEITREELQRGRRSGSSSIDIEARRGRRASVF
jgi:hypothetical protein